ncbi:hypothetical protein [Paracoccus saliphilus]|uniref:DNA packaging protein n=1 Tax=Paracoccus saliphilus TaxID=405559 RepID=A0AA45W2Z4_9RHOB|nr:hypothetical protein [Paracoccus saliphilus]WCR04993.1 DNA packaging protein [Paracoccus saliphilus]SIS71589.1 Phage DNA packaging protein, Nu1 subunit of terminase [Paracoccus saliphilus]
MSAGDTCSAQELADMLGISDRKVREHAAAGHIVKVSTGKYARVESVRTYCEHLRMAAAGRGDQESALDLSRERARLASEQADAQAIKNAALRGELVKAVEVEREWQDVLRSVRSGVLAVPSRARQKLAHLTPHDVEAIDAELRRALERLAEAAE